MLVSGRSLLALDAFSIYFTGRVGQNYIQTLISQFYAHIFSSPHPSPPPASVLPSPSPQVDDSVEALDAAAVEAALSLCEEAVSEGHTLPGPWETQELKVSESTPVVQESDPTPEPQDVAAMSTLIPAGVDTQNQPEAKREEQLEGSGEGPEGMGSDVTPSVTSDDCAAGIEVTEEGPVEKEVPEATVKSEGEEWSQPEPNPPCLGGFYVGKSTGILNLYTSFTFFSLILLYIQYLISGTLWLIFHLLPKRAICLITEAAH